MREFVFKTFCIAVFFISAISFGQGFDKKSLLSELSRTDGVSLSPTEKSSFDKANSDFVSGVSDLDSKNLSQAERDKEIDKLFDRRNKSLKSSLGDSKFGELNTKTNKTIRSTKRKLKLAKLVL